MTDELHPTRQQRRAAERAAVGGLLPMPPPKRKGVCIPGEHIFVEVIGTVEGAPAAKIVSCMACGRTFREILAESPLERAIFEAFIRHRTEAAEHDHGPDPEGLPTAGCAGCKTVAELADVASRYLP